MAKVFFHCINPDCKVRDRCKHFVLLEHTYSIEFHSKEPCIYFIEKKEMEEQIKEKE